jgi:6-pyruvoyltetrahydropterin/6-carboxytetrahydropterin synthase
MPYSITKDFTFSASHQLDAMPDDHQCKRLHGHNYTVRLELAAVDLDDLAMVLDYTRLGVFGKWIDDTLDHRHLNDALPELNGQTTAERLAWHLYAVAVALLGLHGRFVTAVAVSETAKTWATYRFVPTNSSPEDFT